MNKRMSFGARIAMSLAVAVPVLFSLQGRSDLQAQIVESFQVNVATQSSGSFRTPLDAAPDPDGIAVYFTATGPNGPAVFRVAATGGVAEELVTGPPFVAPTGIAISSNGQKIYVADPQALDNRGRAGRIFVIPVPGGLPEVVPGTEGTRPRGMDVLSSGGDTIYFTGKVPSSGEAAVFKIRASGGTPTVVAKGFPLVDPDGLAVTRVGIVYVADQSAAGGGFGSVFKIDDTRVTKIIDSVRTGNPAGIALSQDESLLLISALQSNDNDQVLVVRLRSLQTQSFTKLIGQNRNSSGGLHGVRVLDLLAWVDKTGTIFTINLKEMFTRQIK